MCLWERGGGCRARRRAAAGGAACRSRAHPPATPRPREHMGGGGIDEAVAHVRACACVRARVLHSAQRLVGALGSEDGGGGRLLGGGGSENDSKWGGCRGRLVVRRGAAGPHPAAAAATSNQQSAPASATTVATARAAAIFDKHQTRACGAPWGAASACWPTSTVRGLPRSRGAGFGRQPGLHTSRW